MSHFFFATHEQIEGPTERGRDRVHGLRYAPVPRNPKCFDVVGAGLEVHRDCPLRLPLVDVSRGGVEDLELPGTDRSYP
jgi:hypothetical protein